MLLSQFQWFVTHLTELGNRKPHLQKKVDFIIWTYSAAAAWNAASPRKVDANILTSNRVTVT